MLARVVGRDCALDLLLDDLREDLRGRPIELVRAGESYTPPHPAGVQAGDPRRLRHLADATQQTKLEAGMLIAIAMFQPVMRSELR